MPLRIHHQLLCPFPPAFQCYLARIVMTFIDQVILCDHTIYHILYQIGLILLVRQPYIRQLSVALAATITGTSPDLDLVPDLSTTGFPQYPVCPSLFLLRSSAVWAGRVLIALYPKKSSSSLYSTSKSVMMFTVVNHEIPERDSAKNVSGIFLSLFYPVTL